MKRYQWFLVLAAVAVCMGVLIACKKNQTDQAETGQETKELVLYRGDGAQAVLVYPADASEELLGAAGEIQAAYRSVTGAELPAYPEGSVPEGYTAEIHLGGTAAAIAQGIPSEVSYFHYLCCVREGKLFLYVNQEQALSALTVAFELALPDRFANGALTVAADWQLTGFLKTEALLANIPNYDGGTSVSAFDCDNGHEMLLITGADLSSFNAYCDKVASLGYTLRNRNEMNGNPACTFTNSKGVMLHAYLSAHSGEARLVVSKTAAVQDQPLTSGEYETLLYPLKAGGGMGYVFRLSDGSFLIYDGGYRTEACLNELMQVLKDLAPDPSQITIACWVLTHGHIDHVGTFLAFAERYAADSTVTIQSFMHNMCLTEEQARYIDTNTWTETREAIERFFPDAEVYTPLTGQIYHFGNAAVEILFTMEDYMPRVIENESDAVTPDDKKGNANIQSVVSRVSVNGHTLLMMADTTSVCCDEMCDRYGDYLRSEYVQTAHHGISDTRPRAQNATKEIYALIQPSYALMPCSAKQLPNYMATELNTYLATFLKGDVICSGNYLTTIPLK